MSKKGYKIWFFIFGIWAVIFSISAYDLNNEYIRVIYMLFSLMNGVVIGFALSRWERND